MMPLPPLADATNVRVLLRKAQLEYPPTSVIVRQKKADLDPRLAAQEPAGPERLKPVEAAEYRLSPEDDVLEFKVILALGFVQSFRTSLCAQREWKASRGGVGYTSLLMPPL